MQIGDIMTRDVLCVPPDTPVMDAAGLMSSRGVSCLVVSKDKRPLGMFTVRDIVHLAQIGRAPSRPEISNWMGKPVLTVVADTDIDEAYEILKSHHLRHLVVVDTNENIAGVVSRTDIINHLESEYFTEMKDISSVMHRELVTMHKAESVQAAVDTMAENAISCIVVVEQDRPVGILSEKDVARLFEAGRDLATISLAEAMSHPVFTVDKSAPILDAVQLMHEKRCRRLVVVDDKGRLAGLITQSSVIEVMEDHYVKALKRMLHSREQGIQRYLADTKALSTVVRRLHQATNIDDVHAIAMDSAMHVLHADRTGIYLFDKDGVIRCKAARGLSEHYMRAVEGHAPWPKTDTDAEPVYMADISTAELPGELCVVVRDEGIHAAAFLPLRGEASLFGKLMAYYDQPHAFSDNEIQLGRVLAENLATAMQRLHEHAALQASHNESQQRADEWQRTFDAVADAVLLVDGQGRIKRANAAAVKMYGGDAPLIGQYCYEALHHRKEMLPECAHCVARVEGRPSSQEVYLDYCGAWRVLSAYPVNANDDGTYNVVIVTRDISERKEMEIALRESRDRLAEAQRIAHVGHWTLDLEKNELTWSDEVYRIFGMEPAQFDITYDAFLDTAHPDDREFVSRAYTDAVKNRTPYDIIHRLRLPDGSIRWVNERCETFYDDAGKPLRSVGTVQDITEHKLAEDALRESEARYRKLVELSPDAIGIHQLGRWIYMNPAGMRLFGAASDADIVGQRVLAFVHPDDKHIARDMFRLIRQREHQPFIELRIQTLDGRMLYAEVSGAVVSIGEEPATLIIGHDVTARKTAEAKLEHMARYDDLTDLPSRALFFDRLGQSLAHARRRGHAVAVLYIDLDDFKRINDTQGHQAGDDLLRQVAARLQGCVREVDTVARMGGDEFTCILSEISDSQSAAVLVAEKILAALADTFDVGGAKVRIGGSLGIAMYPDHGQDEDTMISRADAAMYEAKRGGKNQYRFYRPREVGNAAD